jgi:hypothetical protein
MPCPYCGAALPDDARLCRSCGRLIAPGQSTGPSTGPGQTADSATSPPSALRNSPYGSVGPVQDQPALWATAPPGVDPYSPSFDPSRLAPDVANAWRQHRFQATFSVLLVLLVHVLTFGMATPFLVARKFGLLPRTRSDDFSTAKAAGFLFIPVYSLYWVFVLCRRLADRLTLQARLQSVPNPPSRGLATAVAVGWVIGAIPYVGLLVWLPVQFGLWPVYLFQVQRLCNRLALQAAPPEAHQAMLALERAMRLRWIGWVIVVPCLLVAVSSLVVALAAPTMPLANTLVGTMAVLVLAVGGGVLLYLGERGTWGYRDALESMRPLILAAYLRIDKNAAWSVVGIAFSLAVIFVAAGLTTLYAPEAPTPPGDAWPAVAIGVTLALGAGYAAIRAIQLKREIFRLSQLRAAAQGAETARW